MTRVMLRKNKVLAFLYQKVEKSIHRVKKALKSLAFFLKMI